MTVEVVLFWISQFLALREGFILFHVTLICNEPLLNSQERILFASIALQQLNINQSLWKIPKSFPLMSLLDPSGNSTARR